MISSNADGEAFTQLSPGHWIAAIIQNKREEKHSKLVTKKQQSRS